MHLSFPICSQMGRKGMPHGMITWKTCGGNLRLRPKYPFLWVPVPAMHSPCEALSTHLLIHPRSPSLGWITSLPSLSSWRNQDSAKGSVCVCARVVSCANSAIPQTVAHQAPLSVGFPRQKHWSGLPRPPPGDLPDSGIAIRSASQADSLPKRKPHS